MADRTILYVATEGTRVLQRVRFATPTALSRSSAAYYTIKIGVAVGAQVDYFGTFDSSRDVISANVPYDVTGDDDVGFVLEPDAVVVADVTTFGSPPSLLGSGFLVHVGHGIDDPTRRHMDPGDRDTLTAALDFVRASGAGDDRFFVPTSFTEAA